MNTLRSLGVALAMAVSITVVSAQQVPIVQWKFDEYNSGTDQKTAWDKTTNEGNLVLRNGTTAIDLHSTSGTGPSGQAVDRSLTLPAFNSHGFMANPWNNTAWRDFSTMTICGWVKVTAVPYSSQRLLHWTGAEPVDIFFPSNSYSGQICIKIGTTVFTSATGLIAPADVGNWVFIALTYTAGRTAAQNDGVKFYKGTLTTPVVLHSQGGDTTGTANIVNTGPGDLHLGNVNSFSRTFPGQMDNIQIFGAPATKPTAALSIVELEEKRLTYKNNPAELLVNPDFENRTDTNNNADGWWHEVFNAVASPAPQISYTYTYDIGITGHNGTPTNAQKVTVTVPTTSPQGRHLFKQNIRLRGGQIYKASIWLKAVASAGAPVRLRFFARQDVLPQLALALQTVTLTDSNWHQLTIVGGAELDTNVFFGIQTLTYGVPCTYWIDDASLVEDPNQAPGTTQVLSGGPVPGSFFGVHLNDGATNVWPIMGQKMLRLWDTNTRWGDLEDPMDVWTIGTPSSPGFARLNAQVNKAYDNTSNPAVLYTMGMSPDWAVTTNETCNITNPSGHVLTPVPPDAAQLGRWNTYITKVAQNPSNMNGPGNALNQARKIKYWEIWNEVSNTGQPKAPELFYAGSVPQLVVLTKEARTTLKNLDNTYQILSPNILTLEFLEDFLENSGSAYGQSPGGGAQYVDIFSLHRYGNAQLPEAARPTYAAYKDVLSRYPNTAGKPVWNTEGAEALPGSTTPTATELAESAAIVSRKYITQWVDGISNFNWYAWDIFWHSSHGLGTNPRAVGGTALTQVGIGYRETVKWLTGATVVSKTVTPSGTGGERWLVEIKRPGTYRGWIVWDTGAYDATVPWTVPAGVTTLRRLNANSEPASPGSSISIDVSPILLEGGTGPALSYNFDETGTNANAAPDASVTSPLTLRNNTTATDLHIAGVSPWPLVTGDQVFRASTGAMGSGNRNAYFANAGSGAMSGKAKFTITGWLKTNDVGTPGTNKIGGGTTLLLVGTQQIKLSSQNAASGRLDLTINNTGGVFTANNYIPEVGSWVFFAVTYDSTLASGNVKFYRGTTTTPVGAATSLTYQAGALDQTLNGPITVGNNNNAPPDRAFGGDLDRISIYSAVLTPAELESIRTY